MICIPCELGDHDKCTGTCNCPEKVDEKIEQTIRAISRADECLADTVYAHLLQGNSNIVRMMTDGVGRENVRRFVGQIIRTYKAIQC